LSAFESVFHPGQAHFPLGFNCGLIDDDDDELRLFTYRLYRRFSSRYIAHNPFAALVHITLI
jgi:hypothetical protein